MSVTLTNEQFQLLLSMAQNASQNANQTTSQNSNTFTPPSLDDFIENMKCLSVRKLLNMDIVEYIVNTIKHNLDSLEENEYSFICNNVTRKSFYYYDGDRWVKGSDFIKKIYNKIIKQAYNDLLHNYTQQYNDEDDDELNEKRFMQSNSGEKQEIIMNLCHADKISYEKVCEKVLSKISKLVKTNFVPK